MRQTATHGHNGWFGCKREGCVNLPAVYGTRTRCRCEGWQTQNNGKCTACNSPVLADWEWELLTDDNSGGFVETKEFEYPCNIIAYRGETKVMVYDVREESIKAERKGDNVHLSFEFYGTDAIGYIPFVDWYRTELAS